jgi:hypothetical protein
MKNVVLPLIGALVGGIVGYFGFRWMAQYGFYGLILPGGLVGIGAGFFQIKSTSVCVVCGVLALAVGVISEWRFAPFIHDASLGYFLTHLHQLNPVTLGMIAVGAIFGFWWPFSRVRALRNADAPAQEPRVQK